MIITLCGSIAFIDEMYALKEQLEKLGFEVKLPPDKALDQHGNSIGSKEMYEFKKTLPDLTNPFWQQHTQRMRNHFEKVAAADAILVANHTKNGIDNYIGPNTLMEIGLAFFLNKPIFLLHPVPEVAYKEELLGVKPIVLNGKLEAIKQTVDEI